VKTNLTVSVAIATYEMSGQGRSLLRQAFESIYIQDYGKIEVVISDDSRDREVEDECRDWSKKIAIRYFRNEGQRITASKNFNIAIDMCKGQIIKILCQDDILCSPSSISQTVEGLSSGKAWLVTAYSHISESNTNLSSHIPKLNRRIERVNTIGSHSGLAFIRNEEHLHFDEKLFWRMDCDLYRRLIDKYGSPFLLLSETVGVRQWSGQSTNTIIQRKDRIRELFYVMKKYPHRVKKGII
jgi:glycosyltransferase involved in cell wall biosynthesis